MLKRINILICFLLLTSAAQAQITELSSYFGTGCPEGSVSTAVTEDGSIFSVLFDDFFFSTSLEQRFDQKFCRLNIAVSVPSGKRIKAIRAQQNLFFSIPQGSHGSMLTNVQLRDERNRISANKYNYFIAKQGYEGNSQLVTTVGAEKRKSCPTRNEKLVITTSVGLWSKVLANEQEQNFAFSAIDSVDAELIPAQNSGYTVLFENCN
jgi:hypothetical protein